MIKWPKIAQQNTKVWDFKIILWIGYWNYGWSLILEPGQQKEIKSKYPWKSSKM